MGAIEKAVDMRKDTDPANQLSKRGLPQWFALAVKPRFDESVARALERKGFPTFLPLYRRRQKFGVGSKDSNKLPLFPGYVFCQFPAASRSPILTTPGVVHILGNGSVPAALCPAEVASLQTAIQAGLTLRPFPFLPGGERVRIESGVLAGMEGIFMGLKPGLRMVLSITPLQRSALVEIDRDLVNGQYVVGTAIADARQNSLTKSASGAATSVFGGD